MRRLLSIVLATMVLAAMLVVPVQAHEGEHEDDGDNTLLQCQDPVAWYHALAGDFDLLNLERLPVILPGDPDHALFHEAEMTGIWRGQKITVLHFPPSDFSVQGDCHGDKVYYCHKCLQYGYPHGPGPPPCIKWSEYAVICDTHDGHCGQFGPP